MFNTCILPQQTIGIIGGGQLGQMLALSAKAMGYQVAVLDPTSNCPARSVATHFFQAAYNDEEALSELEKVADVITYEFENVDVKALEKLLPKEKLPQGTKLLRMTQNRCNEKNFIKEMGLPVVDFVEVSSEEDLQKGLLNLGMPCVLKTISGGYDGKGQVVIRKKEDITKAGKLLTAACVLEKWLSFEREISVIVAGNSHQYVSLPIGENKHVNNILHETRVPARITHEIRQRAQEMALKLAQKIQLAGVLAVEMFVGTTGELYINELAPRPHNSGHYSLEACDFSQFDLHIKGVCGLPLPTPRLLQSALMLNVLGQHVEKSLASMKKYPNWHVHFYGKKESKYNRKMGHITLLVDDIETALNEVKQSKIWKR